MIPALRWARSFVLFLLKVGSDESHFNVSVGSDGQVTEEKGEPKRYRIGVLPLTSLKPVLNWANVSSRT